MDPRPAVWVGHITLPTPDLPATRDFMRKLGMREIDAADHIAIFELRGGTHLLLLATDAPGEGEAYFDLMVDDVRASHAEFSKLGLDPSELARSDFHESFTLASPSGHTIKVNSTHVSDQPV